MSFDKAKLKKTCLENNVEFLGIFGSVARNSDKPESDIDLLVRFSPNSKISYFKLFDIEKSLANGLGISKKVDLVTQDALNPYIKDRVYSELKIIYGQP